MNSRCDASRFEFNNRVFDDGIGEEPTTEIFRFGASRRFIGCIDFETNALTDTHATHTCKTQRGHGSFDGGTLGISDPRSKTDFDVHREDHAPMFAHRRAYAMQICMRSIVTRAIRRMNDQ